jgi:UDP-3-O-[3-hydroxymyristoyl] glucosamine N-acyltransferase
VKQDMCYSLGEIANYVQGELSNALDAEKKVFHLASLNKAQANDLAMFHHQKYLKDFKASKAGACITSAHFVDVAPENMALIIHKHPYKAFALLTKWFAKLPSLEAPYVSSTAFISPKAKIGQRCHIAHGAYIGDDVCIGDDCQIGVNTVIGPHVVIGNECQIANQVSIEHTQMGNRVVVYSGARIGQDGFGFASDANGHYKIHHQGLVIVGNDVEIGANTCIDRGSLQNTEIGDWVRLDNLIQIGHNVKIGKGTIIAAQSGIAGSTIIGNHVVIGGQVAVSGHLEIGDHTMVLIKSQVIQNVPSNSRVGGAPAMPARQWHRQHIWLKKMSTQKNNDKF